MKITSEKESGFRPITINIVLESAEELEAFYQIGLHTVDIEHKVASNGWNEEICKAAGYIADSLYEHGKKYKGI